MQDSRPNFNVDLTGEVALVTGASAGLGVRFAKVLAAQGAKVALVARRRDKLDAVAEEIRAAGGDCAGFEADLSQADALGDLVERAAHTLGTVSILVNNAGIPDAQYATSMPLDLINQVLNVNVRAPYVLSREVARSLIQVRRTGRIVNISSIGAYAYTGAMPSTLYSVTKAAVSRMTEVLAVEWAKFGINVNAIVPGAFRSEMMDGMIARTRDPSAQFPRKRLGEAAQLDSTLLYLVSPSSEFVTGALIKVDDGQSSR